MGAEAGECRGEVNTLTNKEEGDETADSENKEDLS